MVLNKIPKTIYRERGRGRWRNVCRNTFVNRLLPKFCTNTPELPRENIQDLLINMVMIVSKVHLVLSLKTSRSIDKINKACIRMVSFIRFNINSIYITTDYSGLWVRCIIFYFSTETANPLPRTSRVLKLFHHQFYRSPAWI